MEKRIEFQIVKKLTKAPQNSAGLRLTSAYADSSAGECSLTIATGGSEGNDRVKQFAAARMLNEDVRIKCSVRGKSVVSKISSEDPVYALMSFISGISFVNDDVSEAADFYMNCVGKDPDAAEYFCSKLEFHKTSISEESFTLSVCALMPEEASPEALYSEIMSRLEKYSMGIVKI